jgi:hypothetical protein
LAAVDWAFSLRQASGKSFAKRCEDIPNRLAMTSAETTGLFSSAVAVQRRLRESARLGSDASAPLICRKDPETRDGVR